MFIKNKTALKKYFNLCLNFKNQLTLIFNKTGESQYSFTITITKQGIMFLH